MARIRGYLQRLRFNRTIFAVILALYTTIISMFLYVLTPPMAGHRAPAVAVTLPSPVYIKAHHHRRRMQLLMHLEYLIMLLLK